MYESGSYTVLWTGSIFEPAGFDNLNAALEVGPPVTPVKMSVMTYSLRSRSIPVRARTGSTPAHSRSHLYLLLCGSVENLDRWGS